MTTQPSNPASDGAVCRHNGWNDASICPYCGMIDLQRQLAEANGKLAESQALIQRQARVIELAMKRIRSLKSNLPTDALSAAVQASAVAMRTDLRNLCNSHCTGCKADWPLGRHGCHYEPAPKDWDPEVDWDGADIRCQMFTLRKWLDSSPIETDALSRDRLETRLAALNWSVEQGLERVLPEITKLTEELEKLK